MTNPKYALVHADLNLIFYHKADYIRPRMTGLYSWVAAMGGQLLKIEEMTPELDIIHVNLCTGTLGYPALIKQRLPNTKLVINLDYDIDMLERYGGFDRFVAAMEYGDYLFCVSQSQINGLRHLLSKPIKLMHHPADTEYVSSFIKSKDDRDGIGIMAHAKYNQDANLTLNVARNFRGQHNIHVYNAGGNLKPERFHAAYSALDYHIFVDSISRRFLFIDGHMDLAWGRFQVDGAMLGVPVIGPAEVENQAYLFPDLTISNRSAFAEIDEMVKKLYSDEAFYEKCVQYAQEKLKIYSYETAKQNMLDLVGWNK